MKKKANKTEFIIPSAQEPIEEPQERLFGYLKIPIETVELWPDDPGPLPDPPREHPWPVTIAELDFPELEGGILRGREDDFKKNRNPVLGIECFLLAVNNGVYPSAAIMDWLKNVFTKYHKRQGQQPLDEIMRLKSGPGNRQFKRFIEEERDEMIARDVWKLKKLFGYSTKKAAFMVARKLEETVDWNKSQFKFISKPKAETIDYYYKHKWGKIMNLRPLSKKLTTEKEKQAFLNTFPPDVR